MAAVPAAPAASPRTTAFDRTLHATRARPVNNLTHWAFGMFAGVQYGVVAGSLPRPRIPYGLPFGATVRATGYVILPAAKLYEPIWKYDRKTLARDLSAHLVYGLGTAGALRMLARVRVRGSTRATASPPARSGCNAQPARPSS